MINWYRVVKRNENYRKPSTSAFAQAATSSVTWFCLRFDGVRVLSSRRITSINWKKRHTDFHCPEHSSLDETFGSSFLVHHLPDRIYTLALQFAQHSLSRLLLEYLLASVEILTLVNFCPSSKFHQLKFNRHFLLCQCDDEVMCSSSLLEVGTSSLSSELFIPFNDFRSFQGPSLSRASTPLSAIKEHRMSQRSSPLPASACFFADVCFICQSVVKTEWNEPHLVRCPSSYIHKSQD